jgi:hypothetical protein
VAERTSLDLQLSVQINCNDIFELTRNCST